MRYREFAPGGEASRFIECYWELEGAEPGAIQRVVPDGHPELILNFGEPFAALHDGQWHTQPRSFLAGQITGPLLLRTSTAAHIVGIRLRPAGAAQLLGMPATELTNRTVPLDELGLKHLIERRDIAGIERALLERQSNRDDALVDRALKLLAGRCDIAAAAGQLGISSRQLERQFKARVGMTPKLFARIRRFQHVFRALESEATGWVGRRRRVRLLRPGSLDSRLPRIRRGTSGRPACGRRVSAPLSVAFVQDGDCALG